jgi:hypothetical protein
MSRFATPTGARHACALAVLLFLAAVVHAEDKASPSTITDESLDAALEKAAAAKVGEAEFRDALRSVAPRFEEVKASTETGKGEWTKLMLNARGKHIDAVRFRTPAGDPRDLVWAFAVPKALDRWYIMSVDGDMKQGFKNFWAASAPELFGENAPKLDRGGVVQMLSSRQLEPGKEYLIWFTFKDDQPADTWLTLSFLPPGKSNTQKAAATSLGLPRAAGAAR